jgi:hypothetical protein
VAHLVERSRYQAQEPARRRHGIAGISGGSA